MKQKTLLIFILSIFIFSCFYIWRDSIFKSYIGCAEKAYIYGRNDEALTGFLFASVLDENDSDAMRVRRAKIFMENGQLDAARSELIKSAEDRSLNADVYLMLGKIESFGGEYAKADNYYAKACILDPTVDIFLMRVKNLVRGGSFANALGLINNEGNHYDNDMIGYYYRLIKFNDSGDIAEISGLGSDERKDLVGLSEESYQNYSNLSAGKDTNPDYILVRKADIFNKLNEPDFAFADLQQVLVRNPQYCDALITLGKTYLIENDHKKAIEAIEKCVALDANNSEAIFWLSRMYEKMDNQKKAAEYQLRYEYLMR